MAGQPRNTASLYGSSASLAVNFIRESSFALAQLALGSRVPSVAPVHTKPTLPVEPPPPAGMRQLVIAAAKPRTAKYVMEQPPSVDKLAEKYIEKRRKEVEDQLATEGASAAAAAGIIKVAIK